MSRLFLALAIVWQLSGFAGAAALVCQLQEGQPQSCCCHHQKTDRGAAPHAPVAAPSCPCTMAPPLPAPLTQTPVTASATRPVVSTPAAVVAPWRDEMPDMRSAAVLHHALADTGPPVLSASHLRC
jgi:hypothetical protein